MRAVPRASTVRRWTADRASALVWWVPSAKSVAVGPFVHSLVSKVLSMMLFDAACGAAPTS